MLDVLLTTLGVSLLSFDLFLPVPYSISPAPYSVMLVFDSNMLVFDSNMPVLDSITPFLDTITTALDVVQLLGGSINAPVYVFWADNPKLRIGLCNFLRKKMLRELFPERVRLLVRVFDMLFLYLYVL